MAARKAFILICRKDGVKANNIVDTSEIFNWPRLIVQIVDAHESHSTKG
jgi:hypothetical protein